MAGYEKILTRLVQYCKNLCHRFYPTKTYINQNWVEKGYKKCMTCTFHVITEDLRCKCCTQTFRTTVRQKNHNSNYYQNVLKDQRAKERNIIIKWKQKRYSDIK